MDVKPGAVAEVEVLVTRERTADAMGNRGVMVFATPFLLGLLEDAAGAVIQPHLPPGATTVGTMVEMRHLAPTPVGMKVRARAELLETDGRRFLFSVEAFDEAEKIAEGKHERFMIPSLEKFLSRAMTKGKPGS
ncbi:MAG: thioesterase family protein [Candidatus Rokubacteria bacterium]|nr:thioesterase family protein [Candidatus Rokubacteria bacterium]